RVSWARARHRAACWAERSAIQHGLCHRHRLPTQPGHCPGVAPTLADRATGPARCRCAHCSHGRVVPVEGPDMSRRDDPSPWYGALAASGAPLLWPWRTEAHLVTTGLGPVYDGMGHFLVTPEDLLPVLTLALWAGLRGAGAGRRVLGLFPSAWFVGGCV